MLHWIEHECDPANTDKQRAAKLEFINVPTTDYTDGALASRPAGDTAPSDTAGTATAAGEEERSVLAAEMAAAKMERLGFGVGYRLCERLAQTKPLTTTPAPAPPSSGSVTAGGAGPAAGDTLAATQLEAVKFLCKEFWTEVFRKQIDKLQTNHRGVFVLKDHELRWLRRLPSDDERARVAAIKLLAFPCGLIRGALSNLGIAAVVSCDFLADGKNMSACSFNIKIKA